MRDTDVSNKSGNFPQELQPTSSEHEKFGVARRQMVIHQLCARDIRDPRVLAAMGSVPRERFVPEELQNRAYYDCPLPIGFGQTISQPYVVALVAQLASPPSNGKVLEVGTGCGYLAAVLARLCKKVYGIEIIEQLAEATKRRLAELGIENVEIIHGDGYRGLPEHAPFDAIIVSAAPDHIPPMLIEQLATGGKLIVPVGRGFQDLILVEKHSDGSLKQKSIAPVQFVPMTGEAAVRSSEK